MAPHVIKNRLLPYKVLVYLLYEEPSVSTTPLDLETVARRLKITPSRLRDALRWLSTSGLLVHLSIDGPKATAVPRLPVICPQESPVPFISYWDAINGKGARRD